MLTYDLEIAEGMLSGKVIAGVDEAGRGCLCGPVYAAAVVLPSGYLNPELNDSKKLSPKKRELLYEDIIQNATDYCVARAEVDEIESINILNAALLAMRRALDGLSRPVDVALIDGNIARGFNVKTQTVVKGDSISPSIAAASILAKVSRDRYITELSKKYPMYKLEKHKGYATQEHVELLRQYGPCEIYRMSFLGKICG